MRRPWSASGAPVASMRPLSDATLLLLPAAALLALGTIAALWLQLAGSRAARQDLVPRIEQLLAKGNTEEAYALAIEAENYLPDDPLLPEPVDLVLIRVDTEHRLPLGGQAECDGPTEDAQTDDAEISHVTPP